MASQGLLRLMVVFLLFGTIFMIFADGVNTIMFYSGLTMFIIGVCIMISSVFWSIAKWGAKKVEEFK